MKPSILIATVAIAAALTPPLAAKAPQPPAPAMANGPNLVPIASRMAKGTISVRNTGTATAGSFKITVVCASRCAEGSDAEKAAYTDPAFPGKITVSCAGLEPGHVFSHKIAYWDSLKWRPGTYEFTVVADAANAVAETDETDNTGGTVMGVP